MSHLVRSFLLLLALSAGSVRADSAADLKSALASAQKGDFAAAEPVYTKLLADPAARPEAAAALADIRIMTGRYDEAKSLLEGTVKDLPEHPVVLTKLAEFCDHVGEYTQAEQWFRKALAKDENNLAARRGLGDVLFTLGKRDEAKVLLQWFERFAKAEVDPKTPVEMVVAGRALDRLAVETGRRSFYSKFILTDLYGKAEQADKNCWQSRLAQGELLASRYNIPQATSEFQACLKINPKAVQAHVEIADILLSQWNFEGVEKQLEAVFKVNPKHVAGLQMKAALKLQERRHEDALAAAEEALKFNPNHPAGLGLAAAAAKLIPDMAKYDSYLARARKVNPEPVETYMVIGDKLSGERQFDDAQEMFGLVLKAAPQYSNAWYARGMAYMQTGHEKEAFETLEESYKMDRFNQRMFNTLNLLDRLLKFENIETEHFVVRFSRKEDGVAGVLFARHMEKIYPTVTGMFEHKPKVKTLIEILPEHTHFGVRLTGLPQIHTVGACTGNVIAMDTPSTRPLGAPTPFNWAQVLTHEYAHTVTLSATENRIAHWFTEGLAVWSERRTRSWAWQQMLHQALVNDGLFKLQNINWGFIRPRRPNDRQLAYAQGEWMCHFIEKKWGRKALLDMLELYRQRKKQAFVFKQITGLDEDAFLKEFLEWARQDVQSWGFVIRPKPRKADELKPLLEKAPNDAELLTELARSHALLSKDTKSALEAARKAVAADGKHLVALDTLARLLSNSKAKKDQEEAAGLWNTLYERDPKNATAAERVAAVHMQKKDYAKAMPAWERLTQLMPGNPASYTNLAQINILFDRLDQAAEYKKKIMPLEDSKLAHAQWLAEYYADRDKPAEAITYYGEVLHVDPFNVDAHVAIGDQWLKRTDIDDKAKDKAAVEALQLALESRQIENEHKRLSGRRPNPAGEAYCHLKLARVHARFDRKDEARKAAEAALKIDSESGAKELLDSLK